LLRDGFALGSAEMLELVFILERREEFRAGGVSWQRPQ
jgi:hypothetical protein